MAKDQQVKKGAITVAEVFELNEQEGVGLLSHNGGKGKCVWIPATR